MQLPPIATTTTGSFPKPEQFADRRGSRITFRLEGSALQEALDDATRGILREQDNIGLDLLTDGEQRRLHFIDRFLAGLDGVDRQRPGLKYVYRGRASEHMVPRVIDKVRRRVPAVVEDLRFAKSETKRPVKMALPGPMTVIDSTLNEAYGDEKDLAMDVARAINEELLDLQAAGCDVMQIDEPAMTRYRGKVASYGAEALDRCLEGIHTPTVVHLCYGYPGVGGKRHGNEYPELLDRLMKTRISGFGVEFARSNYDPAILSICKDRLVMFGCVDPGDSPLPSKSLVMERVRLALQYVSPEDLWLAPDCGLMTIPMTLAAAKARFLVDVARELRRTL